MAHKDKLARLRREFHALHPGVTVLDLVRSNTNLGKLVHGMRDSLLAALGGEDHVSPQRQVLVDSVVRLTVLLDAWDRDLFQSEPDVYDEEYRKAVLDRNKMAYLQSQLLGQLGLERVPKPAESLVDVITRIKSRRVDEGNAGPDEGDEGADRG